jgi:hypothetical protein
MHINFSRKTWREENSEALDIGGRVILKWILGKQGGKLWDGCIYFGIGTSGVCCEHGKGRGIY